MEVPVGDDVVVPAADDVVDADAVVDGDAVAEVVDAAGATVDVEPVVVASAASLADEHPANAAMRVAQPTTALMLGFMAREPTGGADCYPVTR